MSKESVRQILYQVKMRMETAEKTYEAGEYENVDEQLANLRDLLDDIYDRPEEDVEVEVSAGG